jgi:hypothetical protein
MKFQQHGVMFIISPWRLHQISFPFIHLGCPWCSLGPSSGIISCCSFSVIPLRWILPQWIHPRLLVGMKISSLDGTHCSFIKFPRDLLSSCNSCLLVLLENQLPVHFWLVDELSKLQSCLELCRFIQALLQLGLQDGKHPFLLELARESNYGTLPNGWRITQATQPKGKMSYLKSHCYD